MAISLVHGRDLSGQEDPEAYMNRQWKAQALAKKLHDRFVKEYGTVVCKEIQTKLLGRHYNTWDKKELDALIASGMTACAEVVGNAAKWTVEILLEEEENPTGDWIPS
jgi:hypothetical protein